MGWEKNPLRSPFSKGGEEIERGPPPFFWKRGVGGFPFAKGGEKGRCITPVSSDPGYG